MGSAIKRGDYIRCLVQEGGLKYIDAKRVYAVLTRFLADGLASQRAVHLGRIGMLKPREMKPRTVTMGFKRSKGQVENVKRQFFVGQRTKYMFRINRNFASDHGLAP